MSITELFSGPAPMARTALGDKDIAGLAEAYAELVVAGARQRADALDELAVAVGARYRRTDARAVAELALRRALEHARARQLLELTSV